MKSHRSGWAVFLRHQAGAVFTTGVDFLAMIAFVQLAGGSPVVGAGVGAATGALTNFLLGRRWIFRATGRSATGQAVRYGLVALGSLALNMLGQYLALTATHLPYVITRAVVASIIGMTWNFNMQRHFVFAPAHPEPPAAP